jgi:hypothetical protein
MKTIHDTEKKSHNIQGAYLDNKYIVTARSIYQPHYSASNDYYYATEVYYSQDGMLCLSNRYFHFTGDYINDILGFKLLRNL